MLLLPGFFSSTPIGWHQLVGGSSFFQYALIDGSTVAKCDQYGAICYHFPGNLERFRRGKIFDSK